MSAQSRRSAQSRNGRRSRRSRASTGFTAITQGVGSSGSMPFGSLRGSSLRALNALDPYHLSLPRPVGPYTVVRTNTIFDSSQEFLWLCPEMSDYPSGPQWSHVIGRASANDVSAGVSRPIRDSGSRVINRDDGFFGPSVSMVPAAFTVQIMNPEALQTTSGIIYIGRSTSQYKLRDDPRTWRELANQFVSFMSPRLCSAGKLALRGVKVDSYPLNMSEYSNFCPQSPIDGASGLIDGVTWDGTGTGANSIGEPSAFAPIVVFNPNYVKLQYIVTIEWRVRFDPSSAAAASHKFHHTTPMSTWDSVISSASSLGHGAMDIADAISQAGAQVSSTMKVLKSLAPAARAVPLPAFG